MTAENISPSVIISSRVRLARNIVDYPFPPVLNTTGRKEIIEKVEAVTAKSGYTKDNKIADVLYLHALSERNLVSREFANDKELHALFVNEEKNTYIMVCEEDHLRIQSFAHGLDLTGASRRAFEAERLLDGEIRFAFDKELGYLTHCPTNLGTAMRASVMMFLPALTMTNRMGELKSQLEKIGITIRGLYGEGSSADAFMYQISNQQSLGINEEDILRKTEAISKRIAEDELHARTALFNANRDVLTDKIMRSLGILKYATMISGKEFCDCYANVRLGVSLGLIHEVQHDVLDSLLYLAMPANIMQNSKDTTEKVGDPAVRDKLRAQMLRQKI